jgi:hypothetical protein
MTRRQRLAERAGHRCEYCKLHSALQLVTYHTDHIHPVAEGGADDDSNRAFACPTCNLRKSDRLTFVDPQTGEVVPVFNPREHVWSEHFYFDGYLMVGRTPIGRGTIAALKLNETQCILIRSVEAMVGAFPPPESV